MPTPRLTRTQTRRAQKTDPRQEAEALRQGWHIDSAWSAARTLATSVDRTPTRRSTTPLRGRLVAPDGSAGAGLRVWPRDGDGRILATPVRSDDGGAFEVVAIAAPSAVVAVEVAGEDGHQTFSVADLAADGNLGILPLRRPLQPGARAEDDAEAVTVAGVCLGEGDCARTFHTFDGTIDRYRYGVHIRLASASLWPLVRPSRGLVGPNDALAIFRRFAPTTFTARHALGEPVDVTAFLDDVAETPTQVPRPATLGLGYIVTFVQRWREVGLSLGDLVYSLPLAPGESHRIVVRDRTSRLDIRDEVAESIEDRQSADTVADNSTLATFGSALRELATGTSRFDSSTDSWSVGGSFGLFGLISASGGGGGSSSSGSSSGTQTLSRDLVNQATQDVHSALSERAASSRRAALTSVRMATTTDHVSGSIRTVTNNNRLHALTMQWWQVLREFEVQTDLDDVQLCVHVPMELVAWLPAGHARHLETLPGSRQDLLQRYATLVAHAGVLRAHLGGHARLRHALDRLLDVAADPSLQPENVDPNSGVAELAFRVELTASFLPVDAVDVTLVPWVGPRIGPVVLEPAAPEPHIDGNAQTIDGALGLLQAEREGRASAATTRVADFSLPRSLGHEGLARLEFSRRSLPYRFDRGADGEPRKLLPAARISAEVDGPFLFRVRTETREPAWSSFQELGPIGVLEHTSGVALAQDPPPRTLSYADLCALEALLQYVLEHPLAFSRAVWQSLTPEERVLLLEPYSVGAAPGGVWAGGEDTPLLDCVENRVLGFDGTSMILPFHLPPPLVDSTGVTTKDLQSDLLAFHQDGFLRVVRRVALPTRGTLGEAVLGGCVSGERIDLTRFWNWQDSAIPVAPTATEEQLPAIALAGTLGAAAPSDLALPAAGIAAVVAPASNPALLSGLTAPTTIDPTKLLPTDAARAAAIGTSGAASAITASSITDALALLTHDGGKALTLTSLLDGRDKLTAQRDDLQGQLRSAQLEKLLRDPKSFADLVSAGADASAQEATAATIAKAVLGAGGTATATEAASLLGALGGQGAAGALLLAAFGI